MTTLKFFSIVVSHVLLNELFIDSCPGRTLALTAGDIFERANFTLFVSAQRSSNQVKSSYTCGQTADTACSDFLELIHRFCQLYGNPRNTTRRIASKLNLHLLPGVHSVKIQNRLRELTSGRTYSRYVLHSCDFSSCEANLSITGHSANTTSIFLMPEGNTTSSCGTDLVDMKDDCSYGWVFLYFGRRMTVHVSDITFKTAFPDEMHTFFRLNGLTEFRLVRCRFPDISAKVGAVLILLTKDGEKGAAYSLFQIEDSEFVYTADGDEDQLHFSKAVRICKRSPLFHATSTHVTVVRCTFRILCENGGIDHYGGSSTSYHGFAIEAVRGNSVKGIPLQLSITDSTFIGMVYRGEVCRFPGSAILLNYDNANLSISQSSFVNLAGEKGSAVNVQGGKQILMQHLYFENNGLLNLTEEGGALSFGGGLFDPSFPKKAVLLNVTFVNCSARTGAAIAADAHQVAYVERRINMQNVRIFKSASQNGGSIHTNRLPLIHIHNGVFEGINGSAIILQRSNLALTGNVSFVRNEGFNGGAISTTDHCYVHLGFGSMAGNITFRSNKAERRGGAIYIDRTTANEVKYCPINLSIDPNKTRATIQFSKNKAHLQGNDLYIHSMHRCRNLPLQLKKNFLHSAKGQVQPVNSLAVTGTSSTFLKFDGADTVCCKWVGETTWLLKDCKFSTLNLLYEFNNMTRNTTQLHNELLGEGSKTEYFYGRGLPAFDLFKPWNSSVSPLGPPGNMTTDISGRLLAMAELQLLPSPGEEFLVNFTGSDQVLNKVPTAIALQLIQLAGKERNAPQLCVNQQCERGAFLFSANRKFFGLSIEGSVGSQGFLRVRELTDDKADNNVLYIPFLLSPCPLGFRQQLGKNNYVLIIERGMWIGSLYPKWKVNKTATSTSLERGNHHAKLLLPANDKLIGVPLGTQNQFWWNSYLLQDNVLIYGQCRSEYCHPDELDNVAGTTVDTNTKYLAMAGEQSHVVRSLSKCAPHREGILCGKCKKGYSTTMYYKNCGQCKNTSYVGVLSITFALGLLLFALLLLWNWGGDIMTSFSTLFFFGQANTFAADYHPKLPHGHEYISRSLNLDWSFGMCLTQNLNALERLAWSYLTPTYLLSLVLISLFLSRFYRLNRIFCRSTCIKMFWQFILLSFSSLASTSFQLLKCVHLHPAEAFTKVNISNWRFADDASFECFAGDHLLWAIIAIFLVGLVCLPLPLVLPFLHHHHLFKPFSDVYTTVYKDHRRWWCSVDLFRRLLLAAVYTATDDPVEEHLVMIQISISLLFIHAIFWPFRSVKANLIEATALFSLTTIAILSGPDMTHSHAVAVECVFALSVCLLLVDIIRESIMANEKKNKAISRTPG